MDNADNGKTVDVAFPAGRPPCFPARRVAKHILAQQGGAWSPDGGRECDLRTIKGYAGGMGCFDDRKGENFSQSDPIGRGREDKSEIEHFSADNRSGVTSKLSVNSRGQLKDTPANRALNPIATSQAAFSSEDVRQQAFFADEKTIILSGDVKERLSFLVDKGITVDTIVTSPPFYGQRDYGVDGQIGLETHPNQFIDSLMDVFDLCRKVLKDTGSLWVNLGDTYWSGKGAHKSPESKQGARRFGVRPQDMPGDGRWARPKQLLLIPHRFAIAMQDAGWLVRNDNVWVKPNPIPDQVRDRCSISHEYVFHFTKERWYFFDRMKVARLGASGRALPPLDTWVVPPSRGGSSHKASFSEQLVRIPILATTPPNGVVLDPFAGSGTTLKFARSHGFRSIGIDLNEGYCAEMKSSLENL